MTVLELLMHPGMVPFAVAIGILVGLLLIEVVLSQFGGSLLGGAEPEADIDADLDPDIDLEGADAAEGELGAAAATEGDASAPSVSPDASALSWLGIGKVPFSIWLAGTLAAFGLVGYGVQVAVAALFGTPMPAGAAAAVVLVPALFLGRSFAGLIGRIMPKSESSAISRRSYGSRRGTITVGTASRGRPAQARFTDGHGNMHYAPVEPLNDDETLPQGTEIAILRQRDGSLRAIRLSDAPIHSSKQ